MNLCCHGKVMDPDKSSKGIFSLALIKATCCAYVHPTPRKGRGRENRMMRRKNISFAYCTLFLQLKSNPYFIVWCYCEISGQIIQSCRSGSFSCPTPIFMIRTDGSVIKKKKNYYLPPNLLRSFQQDGCISQGTGNNHLLCCCKGDLCNGGIRKEHFFAVITALTIVIGTMLM